MTEMNDFNAQAIEQFHTNAGSFGGPLAGMPAILVHHRGRKSGTWRISPLTFQKVDSGYAVFGSFAGAPQHPDWYLNLLEHPEVNIEVGTETITVIARDATGAERDEIFERQKAAAPIFAEYEQKAGSRTIPVVVLEPKS
jgi:deazaflavin-dependent oxidoreductase (nitroreductase family)